MSAGRTFDVTLTATPAFFALLDELACKNSTDWDATILRAVNLLKVAVDAKSEGKRLAILDDEDNSEEEVLW